MESYNFVISKFLKFFSLFVGLLFLELNLFAAPHYEGLPGGPKDYVNRPVGISTLEFQALVSGTKTVVVILVDFVSADGTTSSDPQMDSNDISNLDVWFGTDITKKTFVNYYNEASYGQLTLDVTYAVKGGTKNSLSGVAPGDCFTMPYNMQWYGEDTEFKLKTLIEHAISTSGIHNDNYDYVLVAHAGNGNESTYPTYPGDIWSASVGWKDAAPPVNGFTTGAIIPVREWGSLDPFGVICHEFGHQLGLPDIYAPDTGEARVGDYALMDSGTWNDNGRTPPHPCSWSKVELGWVTPAVITGNATGVVLYSYNSNSSVKRFDIQGTNNKEYFLLSYRKKQAAGYDSEIPAGGPVLLHIDDTIGSVEENTVNWSTQEHPRIDIVGGGVWDASEIFTAPDSDSYDGTVSGITVYNFSVDNGQIIFNTTISEFADVASFSEPPLNFPNPAIGVSATTISFKLTAPEKDKTIRIYTTAGELVKIISSDNIIARYVDDNEVVYYAEWNLRNEAGRSVTSGVYPYLIEVGDIKKQIKKFGYLAIIKK